MGGDLGDSRCLEEPRKLKLDLRELGYVAENISSQKRVSARHKKVVVNANLRDFENFGPVFGKRSLQLGPRLDERSQRRSASREAQSIGQADALLLSGWAF